MARSPERHEFLADILTIAVEDYGTNSWRQVSRYKRAVIENPTQASEVGVVVIELGDGEKDTEHEVTVEMIATGLNRILKREIPCNGRIYDEVAEAHKYNDAGYLDAYSADVILQAGLFNELVYG